MDLRTNAMEPTSQRTLLKTVRRTLVSPIFRLFSDYFQTICFQTIFRLFVFRLFSDYLFSDYFQTICFQTIFRLFSDYLFSDYFQTIYFQTIFRLFVFRLFSDYLFSDYLTQQDKHNICTFSVIIKLICSRCETDQKYRFSNCFECSYK